MWLADVETFQEICPGDWVEDGWGNPWKFLMITRAPNDSSTGRIYVENRFGDKREFFPSVIDARIVLDSDSESILSDEIRAEERREVDDLNRDYINGVAYDANMGW